ncbi:MAG: flagellar FliL protein [Gammaproteobacteria bacterium]|jgi:flagellar FliL protein
MNILHALGTPGRNAFVRALVVAVLASVLLASGERAAAAEDTKEERPKALYLPVHPKVIVNLKNSTGGTSFLMLTATVRLNDEEAIAAARLHMPALRHQMIMLLSEKQLADMTQAKGAEKTRKEVLSALQGFMKTETNKPSIKDIYFTEIVVE